MRFLPTALPPVTLVELERVADERGWFARTWSAAELARAGLDARLDYCAAAHNQRRGTLRGMHFQAAPHGESKLVTCTRGAIYDVAVDVRPASSTRYRWVAVELRAGTPRALFIPPGFAHGYQTLEDDSEVGYHIGGSYVPEAARGLRYDDPALGITWPLPVAIVSARDASYELISVEDEDERV